MINTVCISSIEKPKIINLIKNNEKLEKIVLNTLIDLDFAYIDEIIYPIKQFTTVLSSYHIFCNVDFDNKDDTALFIKGIKNLQISYEFVPQDIFDKIANNTPSITELEEFIMEFTDLIRTYLRRWRTLKYENEEKYFEEVANEIIDSHNYDYINVVGDHVILE